MRVLVTGSAGHLGEALVRTLKERGYEVVALDIQVSDLTTHVGSITDRSFVKSCLAGVKTVFHTATLHKPHVATHSLQDFIDTNITGTLNLLQESVAAGVERFIFTSTTSVFGDALVPPVGEPAAWITEDVVPVPKNIYGVTKTSAENLCQLFYRNQGLPCLILRTSRFFPEADDSKEARDKFADVNLKANEFLFRRVALDDVVTAHLVAADKAHTIGFGTYIISATTPFLPGDTADLRIDAPAVLQKYIPDYQAEYERLGWRMLPDIDRVYDNAKARNELGWQPKYDFKTMIEKLKTGGSVLGPLAQLIGSKGYHAEKFSEGPYPVDH
ncbi:NAD-dependent epimerase/dehydratase family protein [Larkinella rosea]|uniref:NAD(P)-dependent oxidoreductase n=1 Tax=Larkinella rosea TaxID=2025312 RepID=A0A3P1C1Y3_9BACT|nr:NAD(P)-dependent oxidoreductase [Larkinella rosea]RRB07317.1 NAD(P)-dependent oxidoreductase [Larkinella rosea]